MDNEILEMVAKINDISVEEVKIEIEKSIEAAMTDPAYEDQWKALQYKTKKPTVEEFLAFMIRQTMN